MSVVSFGKEEGNKGLDAKIAKIPLYLPIT
jgi:hypothetical protein